MNCPNCGAGLETVPNRNHLRCTHCQTVHFPETTGEGIVLLDRQHECDCPCCDGPLAVAALDGENVGYCTDCRGLLLSSEHFALVVARLREVNPVKHGPVEPIDPAEFRRITHCPQCGVRMDTHTYGGGGNAVIDSCTRCQLVWLDAGELTILERFPVRVPCLALVDQDAGN
jgi:Zn-finger nucleic acid-binding protein